MRINARAFVIGEGAHGSLTRKLSRTFNLHDGAQESQRYETGIKEVWEIPSGRLKAGELHHTFGYPLPASTYGGGWLYAMTDAYVGAHLSHFEEEMREAEGRARPPDEER